MEMFRLDGKRAVVTGGASGIGRATAALFARAGAEVVLVDLSAESADAAAKAIGAESGSKVSAVACDVSDEASVTSAFAEIGGVVDLLVNCAGVAHIGSLQTTSVADFDRLYRVNVRGTFLCMQATAGLSDRFAYSMTKGAVLAMTLSVAKDCLPLGIRCNCISPARVHTPFVDNFVAKNYAGKEAEMMAVLAASQPIGRMGTPEEIAAMALYLCSDAASFITGSDMPIDGGFKTLR